VNHTDVAREPRRILVTGAAGFVGSRIAEHLSMRGHCVLTTDITALHNGLVGDLCDPEFRRTLLNWARPDVVVHAAALVPLTRDHAGFATTNVDASRELAAAARLAGTQHFVLIGSSAVYGIPREHPITPHTRPRPIEAYGRSKLSAETATRDGWQQNGLTILRPRTILGNGRRGIIGTLARWIEDDLVIPLPAGGRHRLQLVDVEDVARIVEHVIVNAIEGTWPVGAPHVGRLDTELEELIRHTGSRSRILYVPRFLFKSLAWLADRAGLMPFTRWHYGTLGHDFAFDPSWTPPGFTYLHRNADVLATVSDTGNVPTGNSSPHTRSWETTTLDRAVGVLTTLTSGVRIARRTGSIMLRAGTLLTRALFVVTRNVLGTATRLVRWAIRESRSHRTTERHGIGTRLLLGPLVYHENPSVYGKALRSLKRHQLASGRIAGLGMIIAAQLRRLSGRGPLELPLVRSVLSPVLDLAGKLRAAHLSAALAEAAPLFTYVRGREAQTPTGTAPEHTDLLVVGSGPGAAMLVHAAKEQGHQSILVLEAGNRSQTPTERHHSLEHVLSEFTDGGVELCLSRPLTQIAQGRVLGGGSEVNSGFHHDLPAHHRNTWCRALGITEHEWLAAEKDVRQILELSPAPLGVGDSVIARGAVATGHRSMAVERWRSYSDTGFHQHGMTRQIWARHPDVPVLLYRSVTRIETRPGGLITHLATGETIKARRVAVCAGPVNTPRILTASGVALRRDLSFNLHPMIRIVARCLANDAGRHDVDPYQAMSANGYKYGGAVSTPSLLGAALGEIVDEQDARTLRSFYASFEPSGRGGFVPTPAGLLPYFSYSRNDRRRLREASETLMGLLHGAGVEPITDVSTAASHPSSVHVFGSLPVGGRMLLPEGSLLRTDPRIAVYDASLLPSAPGVNPQGPVMVLALILARRQLHL
jgi:nucleoside-diphosphate-sugar epimerase